VNTALAEVSNIPEIPEVKLCPSVEFVTFRSKCEFCRKEFEPKNVRHRFCTAKCRIDKFREPERALRLQNKNEKSRSRYLTFDGRSGGYFSSVGKVLDAVTAKCFFADLNDELRKNFCSE